MSDFDVKKLREWIGKAKEIGEPPAPQETRGTSAEGKQAGHERVVQLNLRVGASIKRRMKHLAARDDINLATLLTRMVDLYETQHGALPDITGKPR
jgi:hypothetical protein